MSVKSYEIEKHPLASLVHYFAINLGKELIGCEKYTVNFFEEPVVGFPDIVNLDGDHLEIIFNEQDGKITMQVISTNGEIVHDTIEVSSDKIVELNFDFNELNKFKAGKSKW